jgi:Zn/Cd-binding protein ZinT
LVSHFAKTTIVLGTLLVSANAFSHGHHSHGKPLSEIEEKAANGEFNDSDVRDRKLTDWDGMWQSLSLSAKRRSGSGVAEKGRKDKSKSFDELKAYYRKGYATDIDTIGIEKG